MALQAGAVVGNKLRAILLDLMQRVENPAGNRVDRGDFQHRRVLDPADVDTVVKVDRAWPARRDQLELGACFRKHQKLRRVRNSKRIEQCRQVSPANIEAQFELAAVDAPLKFSYGIGERAGYEAGQQNSQNCASERQFSLRVIPAAGSVLRYWPFKWLSLADNLFNPPRWLERLWRRCRLGPPMRHRTSCSSRWTKCAEIAFLRWDTPTRGRQTSIAWLAKA